MNVRMSWLSIVVSLLVPLPSVAGDDFSYEGTKFDSRTITNLQKQLQPLMPLAVSRAQDALGLSLDDSNVVFRLSDYVSDNDTYTIFADVRQGDPLVVSVYLEPLLRGDLGSRDAILASLTNVLTHAILRQHVGNCYNDLAPWFRGGVPTYVAGQGETKLKTFLAWNWKEPDRISRIVAAEPSRDAALAGCFYIEELVAAGGDQALHALVAKAAKCDGEILDSEEVWLRARDRANAAAARMSEPVGELYATCRELYEGGAPQRQDCVACFTELTNEHPDTYAGEVGLYWLGKGHYHRMEFAAASQAWDRFAALDMHYGLFDDMRYYQLQMFYDQDQPDVSVWCDEYLTYFPDGNHLEKVKELCENVRRRE